MRWKYEVAEISKGAFCAIKLQIFTSTLLSCSVRIWSYSWFPVTLPTINPPINHQTHQTTKNLPIPALLLLLCLVYWLCCGLFLVFFCSFILLFFLSHTSNSPSSSHTSNSPSQEGAMVWVDWGNGRLVWEMNSGWDVEE